MCLVPAGVMACLRNWWQRLHRPAPSWAKRRRGVSENDSIGHHRVNADWSRSLRRMREQVPVRREQEPSTSESRTKLPRSLGCSAPTWFGPPGEVCRRCRSPTDWLPRPAGQGVEFGQHCLTGGMPETRSISCPFWKNNRVGTASTRYASAMSGSSSRFAFRNVTSPAYSSAHFSRSGAGRHGPHQSAYTSTTTGTGRAAPRRELRGAHVLNTFHDRTSCLLTGSVRRPLLL